MNPNIIKVFFVFWFKTILFSIRDVYVFWWYITCRDFDFFRNNEEVPIWSRIILFLSGITEFFFEFIITGGMEGKEIRKFLGYVLYFIFGFFVSACIAVFRILFSPITAIVRTIDR